MTPDGRVIVGVGVGLGPALLADVVQRLLRASGEMSVRMIVVHAISLAAEALNLHHGFTRLGVETPTFAIDLVKLQRLRGAL